jgi:DNA polymerase III delta prime subunit
MNKRILITIPFFIIFVGPQGVGKTTQAILLLRYVKHFCRRRVRLIELTHYVILHRIFASIVKLLGKTYIKFYEDASFTEAPSPRLLKTLFPLLLVLHLISLIISNVSLNLKHKILQASVIEDEGYIFKQLADIFYTAYYCGAVLTSPINYTLLSIIIRKMYTPTRKCIIVYLRTLNHEILRKRCILQGRRHIEPAQFILFQTAVYDVLMNNLRCKVVIVDASKNLIEVYLAILKSFPLP